MRTNFKDIDFPENTMSPTTKDETGDGWDLTWSYKNLVTGYEIGMTMPEKLQPGRSRDRSAILRRYRSSSFSF